ncbi:MAG: AAA-like domain-containing protein [Synechococcus sp.]|nr:AAA-like domain-containing protein [Synechococcus sp.]
MPRSIAINRRYISDLKQALKKNGFPKQQLLAEDLGISLSTVSNFLNGRPVDFLNFMEISERLGKEWKDIADFEDEAIAPEPATPNPRTHEPIELDYPNYIRRSPVEEQGLTTIQQEGSLLRIKAPRKMGKTLLINHLLTAINHEPYHIVKIDLQQAAQNILADSNRFIRWFCSVVTRKLKLDNCLDEYWEDDLGTNYNCTIYFEEYLLQETQNPIIIALDNVDRLFAYTDVAPDFFLLLRSWHEEAKIRNPWKKLRIIIAHATEVYLTLKVTNSPFNVGVPLELPELSLEQSKAFFEKHHLDIPDHKFSQIYDLIGGHPYFLQSIVHSLQDKQQSLAEILTTCTTDAGIYRSHLRGLYAVLEEYPHLKTLMAELITTTEPLAVTPMDAFYLESLGLAIASGNKIKLSRNLYRHYFQSSWSI